MYNKYHIVTSDNRDGAGKYAKILEIPVNRPYSQYYINTWNMVLDVYWISAWANPTWAKYSITLAGADSLMIYQLDTRMEGTMISEPLAYVVKDDVIEVYVKGTLAYANVYACVCGTVSALHGCIVNYAPFIDISEMNPVFPRIKSVVPMVNDSRSDNARVRNIVCDSVYIGTTYDCEIEVDSWTGYRQYWMQVRKLSYSGTYIEADVYIMGENHIIVRYPYEVENSNLASVDLEDWQVGHYAADTGKYDASLSNRICMKTLKKVEPGREYTLRSNNDDVGWAIRGYSEENTDSFVKNIGAKGNGSTFIPEEGINYISITLNNTVDLSVDYDWYSDQFEQNLLYPELVASDMLRKRFRAEIKPYIDPDTEGEVANKRVIRLSNIAEQGFLFYQYMRSY